MEPSDRLDERLRAAGNAITVDDDFAALTSVQDAVVGRRKRRRALIGVAMSAVLIAGGAVAIAVNVLDDGEPDSLSIAGVDDTTPTTTMQAVADPGADGSAETDTQPQPVATVAPPTVPVAVTGLTIEMIDADATTVPVTADLRDAQVNWVVPWRDGFLASRTLYVPQALPSELPEDIAALFPQEVVDLFDGDLPPTIDEATQMLSEAGLLDEVTAVLSEHPEAGEVIYSQPSVEPSLHVSFSTDGLDWQPIDFQLPDNVSYLEVVRSTGDRLIALANDVVAPGPDGSTPEYNSALVITSDLVTWQHMPLPVGERPETVPDFVRIGSYPGVLSVNDTAWVATVHRQYEVDVPALLPLLSADDRSRVGDDPTQVSANVTPDGVALYWFDEQRPEEEPESVMVAWADLGVDQAVVDAGSVGTQVAVTAQWGGEPTVIEPFDGFTVVASSDGFYALAPDLRYSANGTDWTELTTPDDVLVTESLLPIDSGVVVFGWDDDGERLVFRVDGTTDTWSLVDALDLPDVVTAGYFGDVGATPALVINAASLQPGGFPTVTVEHDGFEMTVDYGYPLMTVRLTDADGVVVVDEHTASVYDPEAGHEWIRIDDDGWTLVDVTAGSDIVTIPNEAIDAAHQARPDVEYVESEPDLWLLATLDGQRWLYEDLQVDGATYVGGSAIARNGTTIVISTGPEWKVFDLT